jgi:hypothetical protein
MIRFLKKSLLCLLMVVIPVQGYAAVLQLACGTGAERIEAKRFAKKEFKHKMQSIHKRAETTLAKQVGKHESAHESSSCGACFDCCIGCFAPPLAQQQRDIHAPLAVRLPSSSLTFSGFIPDGIERPPRYSLV